MPDVQSRAARVRELFARVVDTPSENVDALLAAQARGDPTLISEVKGLLAADAALAAASRPLGRLLSLSSAAGLPADATILHTILRTDGTLDSDGVRLAADGHRSRRLEGRVVSHYRVESRIGAGGMGVVYRATDLALGRAAAVKVLPGGKEILGTGVAPPGTINQDVPRMTCRLVRTHQ